MTTDDTKVGNLDMANEADRGLLRRTVTDEQNKRKPRWGITDDQRGRYLTALNIALKLAIEQGDNRGIRGCVETLGRLEGQNQTDEHLADKNARIDSGKATELTGTVEVRLELDDAG